MSTSESTNPRKDFEKLNDTTDIIFAEYTVEKEQFMFPPHDGAWRTFRVPGRRKSTAFG